MRLYILEEDLHEAGLPLEEAEYNAKVEDGIAIVFGKMSDGTFKIKVVKSDGRFSIEVPDDIVKRVHLNDDEHYLPAYYHTKDGIIAFHVS
jgi:hypothetical protein